MFFFHNSFSMSPRFLGGFITVNESKDLESISFSGSDFEVETKFLDYLEMKFKLRDFGGSFFFLRDGSTLYLTSFPCSR